MATQETGSPPREDTSATDRFAGGGTAVQPQEDQTDNALLLRHPFVQQKEQLITGEVSPREQDSVKSGGDQEMVVTTVSEHPSEATDSSSSSHCITEESELDGGETRLVPNSGYGGEESHDRLHGSGGVTKEWVRTELRTVINLEVRGLKDQMSQMKVNFEAQFGELKQELANKQRELEHCQAELDKAENLIKELNDKCQKETDARQRAEHAESTLREATRQQEDKIEQLKQEIERLKKEQKDDHDYYEAELKDAEELVKGLTDAVHNEAEARERAEHEKCALEKQLRNKIGHLERRLNEEREQARKDRTKAVDLRSEIATQTRLLNEMRLEQITQTMDTTDLGPQTPIAGQFTFTQEPQPSPHLDERRIVFSPQNSLSPQNSHTETAHQRKHSSSVDS